MFAAWRARYTNGLNAFQSANKVLNREDWFRYGEDYSGHESWDPSGESFVECDGVDWGVANGDNTAILRRPGEMSVRTRKAHGMWTVATCSVFVG